MQNSSTQSSISVVICTHNPKQKYLERVLNALKQQTLGCSYWELLLIDNASERLISLEVDLSWHPHARHVREEELGLTVARLRGIKESRAEIIIFVDDDNVLEPNYLEVSLHISKDYPHIGAWGGQIRPEFEETPPDWVKPYWPLLALREFSGNRWSNLIHQHLTTPCGAGMCLRRTVAEKYASLVSNDPKRESLDRKGDLLTSCGDSDLAFTACDIGLGTGQFIKLGLIHLIPATRIREDYLLCLSQGIAYSETILKALRGEFPIRISWRQKILQTYLRFRLNSRKRRFYNARYKGEKLAEEEISRW